MTNRLFLTWGTLIRRFCWLTLKPGVEVVGGRSARPNEVKMAEIGQSVLGEWIEVSDAVARLREWVRRLTSGQRIASAGDDPAGLAIREELRSDIAQLRQGMNNLSDGLSLVQTAEASAGQVQMNLNRIQELATQMSTGTPSTEQKQILQNEINQLSKDNDRILQETLFNGLAVHQEQMIEVQFGDAQSIVVTTRDLHAVEFDFMHDPFSAAEKLQQTIEEMSDYRGNLGSTANRLEQAGEAAAQQAENLLRTESQISDLNTAIAMAAKTAQDVLMQSVVAVQVHADSFSEVILRLLR